MRFQRGFLTRGLPLKRIPLSAIISASSALSSPPISNSNHFPSDTAFSKNSPAISSHSYFPRVPERGLVLPLIKIFIFYSNILFKLIWFIFISNTHIKIGIDLIISIIVFENIQRNYKQLRVNVIMVNQIELLSPYDPFVKDLQEFFRLQYDAQMNMLDKCKENYGKKDIEKNLD